MAIGDESKGFDKHASMMWKISAMAVGVEKKRRVEGDGSISTVVNRDVLQGWRYYITR